MTCKENRPWMPRADLPPPDCRRVTFGWRCVQSADRPGKSKDRGQRSEEAGGEGSEEARGQTPGERREEACDQARSARPGSAGGDDPAKLKEQVAALEKEVAALKLKIATLELEKLGAIVTVDKTKDGKETATVNILKKWSGDKDALQSSQERAQPASRLRRQRSGQRRGRCSAQGPHRLELAHDHEPPGHRRGARSRQGADEPDDVVPDRARRSAIRAFRASKGSRTSRYWP